MKTSKISIFVAMIFLIAGCKDSVVKTRTYMANVPKYMSYSELRQPINTNTNHPMKATGKIYMFGKYLFINEPMEGIHIYDNSNPSSPQKVTFVKVPGNVDMAVKNNMLYVDSYIDLITLDISNLPEVKEVSRIRNAFPYSIPDPDNRYPSVPYDTNQGVVVQWNVEKVSERVDDNSTQPVFWEYNRTIDGVFVLNSNSGMKTLNVTPSVSGQGGSMARFMLYNQYLYTVNKTTMKIFNVTTTSKPVYTNQVQIGWNIETLFQYNNKMFIGSQTGMYIYDLANPESPSYLSTFWHVRSCDPVVVEGKYAYVTLRAGNRCGDTENKLSVVDISQLTNPVSVKDYTMTEPFGLGIDNGILFVCDGHDGLKIYNASNPYQIDSNLISHFSNVNAYDVIPDQGLLILIGSDGLYQYDYSNKDQIQLLSHIALNH